MSKMNTINVILKRKEFALTISDVFKDKLHLDDRITPTSEHCIFFIEDFGGNRVMFRTKLKQYDSIIEEFKKAAEQEHLIYKNAYVIKSKQYVYNLLTDEKTIPSYLTTAENHDTKEDLYEKNLESAEWIIKDEKFVK
jgi:hypothetical protein